jgi:hypothetical protein
MAKESKETYSGKLKDQTFEVFDEKVLTWCRKQFGDYYAKGLWRNELTVLDYLNLDDDEDLFTFEMHCSRVYEVLAIKSPKEADHLFQSDRFWTKKWQMEFRQRCRERIFCHLEEICSGEAARQLRRLVWTTCGIISSGGSVPDNLKSCRKEYDCTSWEYRTPMAKLSHLE